MMSYYYYNDYTSHYTQVKFDTNKSNFEFDLIIRNTVWGLAVSCSGGSCSGIWLAAGLDTLSGVRTLPLPPAPV